jgi:hypothetical protein
MAMLARATFAALALALAGLIAWAAGQASFGASFGAMLAEPWGLVTLGDLYLGFLATAFVIALAEPRRPVALCWVVALFVLGNVVTGAWLAAGGLPKLMSLRARRGG